MGRSKFSYSPAFITITVPSILTAAFPLRTVSKRQQIKAATISNVSWVASFGSLARSPTSYGSQVAFFVLAVISGSLHLQRKSSSDNKRVLRPRLSTGDVHEQSINLCCGWQRPPRKNAAARADSTVEILLGIVEKCTHRDKVMYILCY